jgi:hypothetical protein
VQGRAEEIGDVLLERTVLGVTGSFGESASRFLATTASPENGSVDVHRTQETGKGRTGSSRSQGKSRRATLQEEKVGEEGQFHFRCKKREHERTDADSVSDLESSGGSGGNGDDVTRSLVSSDKRKSRSSRPVALPGVKVGVADSGVLDLDEGLSRLELVGLNDLVVLLDLERAL